MTFSWEVTTTPVEVGTIGGVVYKPTSSLTIDSTKVEASDLAALEELLYGTAGTDPQLPTPAEVIAIFAGTLAEATPTEPAYNSTTKTITIPTVTGVIYTIDGEVVPAGDIVITGDTIVVAKPAPGYKFPAIIDVDWLYEF
jgi:hypothetical protein